MSPVTHLVQESQQLLDNVRVLSVAWYYEPRVYYQHSYLVLKTPLSHFEQANRAALGLSDDLEYKYYVTEKNDMGIIWTSFYTLDEAINMKTEHNGFEWRRASVKLLNERLLTKSPVTTVLEIKRSVNTEAHAKYQLLS